MTGMAMRGAIRRGWHRSRLAAAVGCAAVIAGAAPLRAAEPATVRIDRGPGGTVEGRLESIDETSITVAAPTGPQMLAIADVRTVARVEVAADAVAGVVVELVDGGTLSGDDFAWAGGSAVIARGDGRIELPIDRVARVAWRRDGIDPAAPAWREALPEAADADIVVVAKGDGFECVSCAIAAVSADAVTVVLDEETIPVKRPRVAGLVWLRDRAGPVGGVPVTVDGGRVTATRVAWSPAGLVLDGDLRLPSDMLVRIDYAAGRTVFLATLPPEASAVEPFFGGLAADPQLAAFFAPRRIAGTVAGGEPTTLLVRPRTTATWRIPEGSRRFRTSLAASGPRQATGPVAVTIGLDGREAFRCLIDPAADAAPVVDLDVSTARRLSIAVEFESGAGMGCAVRWADPVFER